MNRIATNYRHTDKKMGLMPLGPQKNARPAGGQQLVDLQIVYMKVKSLPNYGRTPPEKAVLQEHSWS